MGIVKQLRSLSTVKQFALLALTICVLEQCAGYFLLPVDGHDASSHLQWITFFRQSISQGVLYPRWMQRGFHGFGAPIFYFYPPFTYVVAAGISFITTSTDPAQLFYLTGAFATILSIVGCYYLCLQIGLTKQNSLFAATIYGFAPYRFLDLFIRSALSEQVAMAFLPFLFWGIELSISSQMRRRKLLGIILTALSWSAVLLTNLPVAAVCAIGVPCYILFRVERQQFRSVFLLAAGFAIGTSLSAIYLIPMLHFYPLLNTANLLGAAHVGSGNVLVDILAKKSLSVNLYSSLMLGAIVVIGFKRCGRTGPQRALNALLIFVLALQLPYLFTPLFAKVIPFTVIQAPWRCDVILSLAAAIVCALRWVKPESNRAVWMLMIWFVPSAILSLLVLMHVQINPHPTMNYASTPEEYLPTSSARVSDSVIAMHASDPVVRLGDTLSRVASIAVTPYETDFVSTSQRDTKATFHDFYWPDWQATSDGNVLAISEDSLGRVVTPIPQGTHRVKLTLDSNNTYQSIGLYTSIGSLIMVCLLWAVALLRRKEADRATVLSSVDK